MGISLGTTFALRDCGHDVDHLRELGLQRLPDEDIVARAARESRVVLTCDLDFGDLLATGALTIPSVIIFRLHDETPATVTRRLLEVLSERAADLDAGAIITVEDARYRIRRLPIGGPE